MPATRHFLELKNFTRAELDYLMARTRVLKSRQRSATLYQPPKGKTLAMIFEKNSTHTRVSFEAGTAHLAGAEPFFVLRGTPVGCSGAVGEVFRLTFAVVGVRSVPAM